MKRVLQFIFTLVLLAMLTVTIRASLGENVFTAGGRLWADWWFKATLVDAYSGFAAVFVWIGWRERSGLARATWFVLLMTLGNIAIAAYFLLALKDLEGPGIDGLFTRKAARA